MNKLRIFFLLLTSRNDAYKRPQNWIIVKRFPYTQVSAWKWEIVLTIPIIVLR